MNRTRRSGRSSPASLTCGARSGRKPSRSRIRRGSGIAAQDLRGPRRAAVGGHACRVLSRTTRTATQDLRSVPSETLLGGGRSRPAPCRAGQALSRSALAQLLLVSATYSSFTPVASPEVGRNAVQLLDRHGNGHHPVSQLAERRGENEWRRRESNPRPKALDLVALHA